MVKKTRRTVFSFIGFFVSGTFFAGCIGEEQNFGNGSDTQTNGSTGIETSETSTIMQEAETSTMTERPRTDESTTTGNETPQESPGGGIVCDPSRLETIKPTSGNIRVENHQGGASGETDTRERVTIVNTTDESLNFSGYVLLFSDEKRHTIGQGDISQDVVAAPRTQIQVLTSGGDGPRTEVLESCPPSYVIYTGFEGSTLQNTDSIRIVSPDGAVVVEKQVQ